MRQLIKFEADRAERLLDEGAPLIGTLHGAARIAIAGYLAGGRAALKAIADNDYDVLRKHAEARQGGHARGHGPLLPEGEVTMNTDEAYQQCEQITWEQARNFAYGIRLLPPAKRRALAAVYAFARRIDDIGDGDLPARDQGSPA